MTFTDFFKLRANREDEKWMMGNMSEKLEAMRNSVIEDGGQFPKNRLQAKFINSMSQANF